MGDSVSVADVSIPVYLDSLADDINQKQSQNISSKPRKKYALSIRVCQGWRAGGVGCRRVLGLRLPGETHLSPEKGSRRERERAP